MTDISLFFFCSIIAMIDLLRINSCLSNLYRRALSVRASQVILQRLPLLDSLHVLQPAMDLVQVRILGLIILVLVWELGDKHGRWLVQRRLDQEEKKDKLTSAVLVVYIVKARCNKLM